MFDRIPNEKDQLHEHNFSFFPEAENLPAKALRFTTSFIRSADKQSYHQIQSLKVSQYGSHTSIIYLGDIKVTPQTLRKLADELEAAHKIADENLKKANESENNVGT